MASPELLHSFDEWVLEASADDVTADERAAVARLEKWPGVLTVPEDETDDQVARLRHDPRVAIACHNWRLSPASASPGWLRSVSIDQHALEDALTDRFGPLEGELGTEHRVHVAVIDTGVAAGTAGSRLASRQIDAVALGTLLRTQPHDPDGHGSVVAAIINLLAPAADITSLRCFGRAGTVISDVIYGLLFGRLLPAPVDLFNLSFSVGVFDQACPSCGYQLATRDDRAQLRNLFEYLSAEGYDRPTYVAAAGRAIAVATPAALPGVIAVGSTGASDPTAPRPDPGYREVPSDFLFTFGGSKQAPITRLLARARGFFGTSFATAVVTGVIARLLGQGTAAGHPYPCGDARQIDVVRELRGLTWRGYPAYDPPTHGMGVLRRLPLPGARAPTEEAIRKRAYEIFLTSGRDNAEANWFQAELELSPPD
jgi:hypothetical protein